MAASNEAPQNERLAVMEETLKNIHTLLVAELRHIRETQDRDRQELSTDIGHVKANVQTMQDAVNRRFETFMPKSEIELMKKEADGWRAGQTWFNRIVATTAFGNMATLIFFLIKHMVG
ncbi:hypothetical protein [Brevundimonas sp.]|uniref:hypothetical protein n=1 Tax=Brevundimonas sp. TaxID=1871086 RepID=UPI00289B87A8|nr:hypothetical protein [Brevundimonas sp.]